MYYSSDRPSKAKTILITIVAVIVVWIGYGLVKGVLHAVDGYQLSSLSNAVQIAVAGGLGESFPADGPITQPAWSSVLGGTTSPSCGSFRNGQWMFQTTPSTTVGGPSTYTITCSTDFSLEADGTAMILRRQQ